MSSPDDIIVAIPALATVSISVKPALAARRVGSRACIDWFTSSPAEMIREKALGTSSSGATFLVPISNSLSDSLLSSFLLSSAVTLISAICLCQSLAIEVARTSPVPTATTLAPKSTHLLDRVSIRLPSIGIWLVKSR